MPGLLGLLLALLVGGLLRGAYQIEFAGEPEYRQPAVDAGYHDYWARGLALPDWEPWTFVADPQIETRPFLRPPGYPYLLAAVYALTDGSYVAPRVLNSSLGLLSIVLVWALALRLGGPSAAGWGALLCATAWTLIYFEGELHAETLAATLLVAAILVALPLAERPGPARGLAVGLLLGAAALVRTNALALVPLVIAWCLFVAPAPRLRPRRLVGLGCLALGATLALAPATIRNWRVSGELVPVSSNLGVNLYLGNNPQATPFITSELPDLVPFENCYDYPALVRALERQLGQPLGDGEASREFTRRALAWIVEEPAAFARLTARKAWHLIGPREASHNKEVELERRRSRILSLLPPSFPLILAAALLGAGCLLARRERVPPAARRGALLVALAVLTWFASVLPFFVAGRYRLPVLPLLAALAGVGLGRWLDALRARHWRSAAVWSAALLLTSVALARPWEPERSSRSKWHVDRARAYHRGGDAASALEEARRASELGPGSASARYTLGYAMMLLDREDEAVEQFETCLRLDGRHRVVRTNLAALLARRGELERAIELFREQTGLQPDAASAHRNLAIALSRAERHAQAEEAFRAALRLAPQDATLRSSLASELLALGRHAEAIAELRASIAMERTDPRDAVRLAWLLVAAPDPALRDPAQAARLAQDGLAARPRPAPELLHVLAAARAATGHTDEAARLAEQAADLFQAAGLAQEERQLRATAGHLRAGRIPSWSLPR